MSKRKAAKKTVAKKAVAKKAVAKKAVAKKADERATGSGSSGQSDTGTTQRPEALSLHDILLADIVAGSRAVGQCYTVAYIADRNRISTSTVYNHLRQMHRDGEPIYKTPRGLVYNNDASLEDMAKTHLRMANRINSVAIESNGISAPTIAAWTASNHPDRGVVIDVANSINNHNHTGWTRMVRNMYNIVDTLL